ncbi:hypothetical protein AgCh_024147 [Apium graveolens]
MLLTREEWLRPECRRPKREKEIKEEANIVQFTDDEPALLLNECEENEESMMLVNEEKVAPKLKKAAGADSNLWYLDNGASNHMSGQRTNFKDLDEKITGRVKFGDVSMVHIKGKGSVIFKCKNGEESVLREVYYILSLCHNIISLGQLAEKGNKVTLNGDLLWVHDKQGKLLMRVKRSMNRIYKIILESGEQQCLKSKSEEDTWLWHSRLGHVNFKAMTLMDTSKMDKAFGAFKKFRVLVENGGEKKIKTFRTDRGGEFCSNEFMRYCEEAEIARQFTAPYTPQQNCMFERRNMTMVEIARSLLKGMKLPNEFWGEVIRHSIYILNRLPARAVSRVTPYEACLGKKPHIEHIRVFGYLDHMKVENQMARKLDDRSVPVIHLGKEPDTKAYKLYNPVNKIVHVSRDIVFEEKKYWLWGNKENSEER